MTLVLEKFTPVCPPHIYAEMFERGITPRKILLLAHDVAAKEEEYRKALAPWAQTRGTIILDNSVIELGGAVDLQMYKQAYDILYNILDKADSFDVNPSKAAQRIVVVLPDVLEKGNATIELSTEAWHGGWRSTFPDSPYMIIPQGKDLEDWLNCFLILSDRVICGWVGIPRNTTGRIVKSRATLVDLVARSNKSVHLMGFSDYMTDDFQTARHWAVQSIDSAVPLRTEGLNALKVTEPRGEWWEHAQWEDWIEKNLEYVSKQTTPATGRF